MSTSVPISDLPQADNHQNASNRETLRRRLTPIQKNEIINM